MSERVVDRWMEAALALYAFAAAAALIGAGMHVAVAGGSLMHWSNLRAALGKSCATLTYDDGFYYLKIAENVARGRGSTFDGVNPTNGYHPLWLAGLVPIFWLTSSSDTALILAVAFQCALLSIAAALTYRIVRLDAPRWCAVLAVLIWVHAQLPYRAALSGLEYSLNAVSIFAVIYVWRRFFSADAEPGRVAGHLALGTLLGMSALARLDNLLLAGCIGLALAWRELRRGLTMASARRLIAFSAPVAGIVLTYAIANLVLFGHPLPVNGVIKRDWSMQLLKSDPVYRAHGWIAAKLWNLAWPFTHTKPAFVFFLTLGSLGAAVIWTLAVAARARTQTRTRTSPAKRRTERASTACSRAARLPGALVLFSILQVSLFNIVYHDGYSFQRWYYAIQPWLAAVIVATLAEIAWRSAGHLSGDSTWIRHLAPPLGIAIALGVVLASARTIRQWHDEAALGVSREPLYAAASWVGASVPAGATVGAWNAGTIGYLSEKRVVNLDGLVNSWEFYQTGQKDLCRYWRQAGITYLVDTFEIDREVSFIDTFYAPGADLSPCVARLRRIWIGPAYLTTSRHAEAFELRFAP